MRKTPESIEGSTRAAALTNLPQRDPVYSNPSTLSLSRPLTVPTYQKALHLPHISFLTLADPFFPPGVRVSLLHDAPSLLSSSLRAPPRTLPPSPYNHLPLCALRAASPPHHRRSHTLSSSLSLRAVREHPKQTERQRPREGGGRGNERANGGAGSLRSCATRTSQPRATVARRTRCPFKGIAR